MKADFSVEVEDGLLAIYLESRGGRGRNPDYNARLGDILTALGRGAAVLEEVTVESTRVRDLPMEDRRVRLEDWHLPLQLGQGVDLHALRLAIGRGQEPIGREAEGAGGNRTKRIRIAARASVPIDESELSGWIEAIVGLEEGREYAAADESIPVEEFVAGLEGQRRKRFVTHIRRERRLRAHRIALAMNANRSLCCEVLRCGFDFEKTYGSLGSGYAQVHHLQPLAEADGPVVTHLSDLLIVCANCHAMIHRGGECRDPEMLIPMP